MVDGTRDQILDAAERLLARLGYTKTTVEEIAREAGISKRTVYLYFPSKEEVVLCTIDRIVERLLTHLREIAQSSGTPADRLRRMLRLRVMFRFDSVRDYYQSLDELLRSIRTSYMARRARYFAEEAAVFVAVIEEGRSQSSFVDRDASTTARTLLLATNALLPSGLSTRELGQRDALEAQTDAIADLLIEGLWARP